MGLLSTVKDALVPDTDPGVAYECANCGYEFDEARERCPECGSTEILEREGFDMRPDA